MTLREWAEEELAERNPDALFMDGLDDAIVGITAWQAGRAPVVVYDEALIIEALTDEETTEEEAWDHYGFNILGGYFGENQPLIIKRPEA